MKKPSKKIWVLHKKSRKWITIEEEIELEKLEKAKQEEARKVLLNQDQQDEIAILNKDDDEPEAKD